MVKKKSKKAYKKRDSNQHRAVFGIAAVLAVLLLLVLSYSYISKRPVGLLKNTPDENLQISTIEPRGMSEHKGGILYGPYSIGSADYYYFKGEVLNSRLEPADNKKAESLHNFYLSVRDNPLFYSPYDDKDEINFTEFETFNEQMYLQKYCNIDWKLFPIDYFNAITGNIMATERFLKEPSYENAGQVIENNKKALAGYVSGLQVLLKAINQSSLPGDKCELVDFESFEEENYRNYAFELSHADKFVTKDNIMAIFRQFNDNAKKLSEEISYKQKLLNSERSYSRKNSPLGKMPPIPTELDFMPRDKALMTFRLKQTGSSVLTLYKAQEEIKDPENPDYIPLRRNLTKEEMEPFLLPDLKKEDIYLFSVGTRCLNFNNTLVYGVEAEFYPNLIMAEKLEFCLDDVFAVCECPYTEETILTWYVMKNIFLKVASKPLYKEKGLDDNLYSRLKTAEVGFLEFPSQERMQYLKQTYGYVYNELIEKDSYWPNMENIWKRKMMIGSKIYRFKKTLQNYFQQMKDRYEYFYFPGLPIMEDDPFLDEGYDPMDDGYDPMDDGYDPDDPSMNEPPPPPESLDPINLSNAKRIEIENSHYYKLLLVDSEFYLSYMPWSENVWQKEEEINSLSTTPLEMLKKGYLDLDITYEEAIATLDNLTKGISCGSTRSDIVKDSLRKHEFLEYWKNTTSQYYINKTDCIGSLYEIYEIFREKAESEQLW